MKYYYKKNFDKEVLDWQTLLNNFNKSLIEGKEIKHNPIRFFVSHEAHKIPELKKDVEKLKDGQRDIKFSNGNGH
jgi:hypothetical protein